MNNYKDVLGRIYEQAKALNACDKFKGNETEEELIKLFSSVQGVEFCMKNRFPNLSTCRMFKTDLTKYNIYLDKGEITLTNPSKAILLGRTTATMVFDNNESHNVYVMKGASAVIVAKKWSVVRVEAEQGCNVIKQTNENAIII